MRSHLAVMLADPFATVATGARGGVLTVLSRTTRPLTGRTVASLVRPRASLRTVQVTLADLVLHGVVLCEQVGRANQYTLSRDHLAAAPILALAGIREELFQRVRTEALSWTVPAVAVWLFGSVARGEDTPSSDVDLVLVRPDNVSVDNPHWRRQVEALTGHVYSWTGNPAEVLEFSVVDFHAQVDRGGQLIDDLRRDAVHLAGQSLQTILIRRVWGDDIVEDDETPWWSTVSIGDAGGVEDMPIPDIIRALQGQLGWALTAHIASADANTLKAVAAGNRSVPSNAEQRLRAALHVFLLIQSSETNDTARAWLTGLNPQLGGETPADALRAGNLQAVLTAAEAFVEPAVSSFPTLTLGCPITAEDVADALDDE